MRARRNRRQAFTLVELLVVIIIIGVLAALVVPAVATAIARVEEARIRIEIGQMASALEQYRLLYDEYPPDPLVDGQNGLKKHLLKAFPRIRQDELNNLPNLTPANCLYFYLRGYSTDPERPITGAVRRDPLFDFQETRLGGNATDYAREYWPRGAVTNAPYVYFRRPKDTATNTWNAYDPNVQKYTSTVYGTIEAAKVQELFQIHSAGLDGDYGNTTTAAGRKAMRDNIASFTTGAENPSGQ